jgi:chromosome segregation ATPase
MNNEDFERQMALIAARHAQWEGRMEKVDRQIAELVGFAGVLRDALLGLTHHVERHDQQIAEINRGLAELVERGKETDARLNALMLVVERHISGHQ